MDLLGELFSLERSKTRDIPKGSACPRIRCKSVSIQSNKVDDVPKATNYVTTALASLKAGKAPDPALTVPYGCDVKY